jgi:hypothetical protein
MIFEIFPIKTEIKNPLQISYGSSTVPLPRVKNDKEELERGLFLSLDLNERIKKLENEIEKLKGF